MPPRVGVPLVAVGPERTDDRALLGPRAGPGLGRRQAARDRRCTRRRVRDPLPRRRAAPGEWWSVRDGGRDGTVLAYGRLDIGWGGDAQILLAVGADPAGGGCRQLRAGPARGRGRGARHQLRLQHHPRARAARPGARLARGPWVPRRGGRRPAQAGRQHAGRAGAAAARRAPRRTTWRPTRAGRPRARRSRAVTSTWTSTATDGTAPGPAQGRGPPEVRNVSHARWAPPCQRGGGRGTRRRRAAPASRGRAARAGDRGPGTGSGATPRSAGPGPRTPRCRRAPRGDANSARNSR